MANFQTFPLFFGGINCKVFKLGRFSINFSFLINYYLPGIKYFIYAVYLSSITMNCGFFCGLDVWLCFCGRIWVHKVQSSMSYSREFCADFRFPSNKKQKQMKIEPFQRFWKRNYNKNATMMMGSSIEHWYTLESERWFSPLRSYSKNFPATFHCLHILNCNS